MARKSSSPSFKPTYPPWFRFGVWGERSVPEHDDMQRRVDDNLGRMLRSVYWGPRFLSHERHLSP